MKNLFLPITNFIDLLVEQYLAIESSHYKIIVWQILIVLLITSTYYIAIRITKIEGGSGHLIKAALFSLMSGFSVAFIANDPSLSGIATIIVLIPLVWKWTKTDIVAELILMNLIAGVLGIIGISILFIKFFH